MLIGLLIFLLVFFVPLNKIFFSLAYACIDFQRKKSLWNIFLGYCQKDKPLENFDWHDNSLK